MTAINGYIDGNTVVALDDGLKDFVGSEILIRLVEKPKEQIVKQPTEQKRKPTDEERMEAIKAISGILHMDKPMTIKEIREERLRERYGLW